jgi:hypothetical protein
MVAGDRKISVVGRFGIWPTVRLSLPARRLLAYLALRNGEVSRKRAAAELWPETSEDVCPRQPTPCVVAGSARVG